MTPVVPDLAFTFAATVLALSPAVTVTVAVPKAPFTTIELAAIVLTAPVTAVDALAPAEDPVTKSPAAPAVAATEEPIRLLPYLLVLKLAVVAVMVWLALAPTWNTAEPKLPSSNF